MNNTPMKRQAPRRMFRLLRGLAICAGASLYRAKHQGRNRVVADG